MATKVIEAIGYLLIAGFIGLILAWAILGD